jgi:hypothetical protein
LGGGVPFNRVKDLGGSLAAGGDSHGRNKGVLPEFLEVDFGYSYVMVLAETVFEGLNEVPLVLQ